VIEGTAIVAKSAHNVTGNATVKSRHVTIARHPVDDVITPLDNGAIGRVFVAVTIKK